MWWRVVRFWRLIVFLVLPSLVCEYVFFIVSGHWSPLSVRSQVKLPFVIYFDYGCLADVAVYKEVFEKIVEEEDDEDEDDDEIELDEDEEDDEGEKKAKVVEFSHAQPWMDGWMDGHSVFWTSLRVTS